MLDALREYNLHRSSRPNVIDRWILQRIRRWAAYSNYPPWMPQLLGHVCNNFVAYLHDGGARLTYTVMRHDAYTPVGSDSCHHVWLDLTYHSIEEYERRQVVFALRLQPRSA